MNATDNTFAEIRERGLGPTYEGMAVEVFSFGRWYGGILRKLNRTRALVEYRTGSGAVRTKAFPEAKVRISECIRAAWPSKGAS